MGGTPPPPVRFPPPINDLTRKNAPTISATLTKNDQNLDVDLQKQFNQKEKDLLHRSLITYECWTFDEYPESYEFLSLNSRLYSN